MIQEMKNSREIVIKEIMLKTVSGKITVNEGLKQINLFDKESKDALLVIQDYEQMCYQYTGSDMLIRH
jgi:hypothetical protein